MNTYRCLFGVDIDVVPGGCEDPDTVVAGAAPQSPTQSDLKVRDGLIQSQEVLLNVYRCQYNIDTQLVPGGCAEVNLFTIPEGPRADDTLISAGRGRTCAVRVDGGVACWGRYGLVDRFALAGLTDVVAITTADNP